MTPPTAWRGYRPLTTFLVGFAAARAGGDADAVAEAARKAVALARRWAEEDTEDAAPDTPPAARNPIPARTPDDPAHAPGR